MVVFRQLLIDFQSLFKFLSEYKFKEILVTFRFYIFLDEESDEDEENEEPEEKSNLILKEEKPIEKIELEEVSTGKKKRKRNQNKCLNCKEPGHLKKDCPELSDERRKELQELYVMKIERKGKGTGRKKNKKRKLDEVLEVESKKEEPKVKKQKRDKKERKGKKLLRFQMPISHSQDFYCKFEL